MVKSFKDKIRQKLVTEYRNLFSRNLIEEKEVKELITRALEEISGHEKSNLSDADRQKVVSELLDEFTGFGPLENLLRDPSITEIMINGPGKVYIERAGKTVLSEVVFDSEQQLMHIVQKILAPTRRRVDESYPYTDVSLKDGSRINIIIPPLALDGPVVTVRKFLKSLNSMEELISKGTLDRRMADFLLAALKARLNIIFSGATGAGKTTTLNVLSSYISNDERIVTIEDTAELSLNQEHIVRLETRQPNIEGRGEVSIRELFKNCLRMRPERIILGEIRGAEALDMLQAMCSGHTGSLAVIHADSPQDVIYRLETLILTSGIPISLEAIHRQIAASVHLIVQQQQLSDGTRKITHISQVHGLHEGQVIVEDIFLYEMEETDLVSGVVKGSWKATGEVPVFYPKFKKLGIELSEEIFRK